MGDIGEIKGRITIDASGAKKGAEEAEQAVGKLNGKMVTANEAAETARKGYMDAAQSATTLAMSGYVLYDSYDGVQQAQTASERANLKLSKAEEAAIKAQNDLNDAVAKYGADSPEAQQAALNLEQAQQQLAVATENADMAAGNCDDAWVQFALGGVTGVLGLVSGGAGLIKGLKGASEAMKLAGGASKIFNGSLLSLAANPVMLVLMAIAAVALIIMMNWDTLKPYFEGIFNFFKGIFEGIYNAILAVWNWIDANVIKPLMAGWDFVVQKTQWMRDLIAAIWNGIYNAIMAVWNFIDQNIIKPIVAAWDLITGAAETMKRNLLAVWDGIKNAIKTVVDTIMGFIKPLLDAMQAVRDGVGSVIPDGDVIPGLHLFGEGGHVTRPTLSVTGEKEGEWMIPDSKLPGFVSAMVSNSGAASGLSSLPGASGGRGSAFNNVFNISTNDPEEVAQTVVRALQMQGFRSGY